MKTEYLNNFNIIPLLAMILLFNLLMPGRRQAIIWTNAGMVLIGPLGN